MDGDNCDDDINFKPSATIGMLQARASLLHHLRNWFVEQGYWECQTPVLSRERINDANIELFTTVDDRGETWFLQSSPEACMKRLLAVGADSVFQIGPVMRLGERGTRHNPEFTIVEWYKIGDSYRDQMSFTEQLVRGVYAAAARLRDIDATDLGPRESKQAASFARLSNDAFERVTYDAAFERFAGSRVLHLSPSELVGLARQRGIDIPRGMTLDRDSLLNLLLAELVEPRLGEDRPQFLCDYPDTQAALAKVESRGTEPSVALRFELYDRGIELCNGYQELTVANPIGLPRRLTAAMESGLPECSGVALGFDRLVMLALGANSISEVVAFPSDVA